MDTLRSDGQRLARKDVKSGASRKGADPNLHEEVDAEEARFGDV